MATIAQPTIVTTRPVYYVNRSEMTSARGVLKLLQVVAGVICYALFYVKITIFVGSNDLQRFGKNVDDIMNRMTSLSRLTTLLHQTSFCFWLVTFLMLVTCFKTQSTGSLLRMTAFEPIYHIVAGILYLSGGIGLIIVIRGSASIFPNLFAAACFGTAAGVLHAIHGHYSWKDWQAQKNQPMQIPQVVQTGQTPYVAAQPAPTIVVQSSYPTVQSSYPTVQASYSTVQTSYSTVPASNQPQYKQ